MSGRLTIKISTSTRLMLSKRDSVTVFVFVVDAALETVPETSFVKPAITVAVGPISIKPADILINMPSLLVYVVKSSFISEVGLSAVAVQRLPVVHIPKDRKQVIIYNYHARVLYRFLCVGEGCVRWALVDLVNLQLNMRFGSLSNSLEPLYRRSRSCHLGASSDLCLKNVLM